MSGILGVFSLNKDEDVINYIQYGLYALQHRGQEGYGVVTLDRQNKVYEFKRKGLLQESIDRTIVSDMKGYVGLGIVKYAFGHNTRYEPVMPYVYDAKYGHGIIAIDGNISNEDFHISELIEKINSPFEAEITEYIASLNGAFSMVFVSNEKLIAIRDKHGIKPLCIGKMADGTLVASSESCALDALGAALIKDLECGEIFIKTDSEEISIYTQKCAPALCLFEMIYIARPDSDIDGVNVYDSRYKMGKFLYMENPTKADVVIGSPDSGLIAAKGYAKASGIEYVDGIVKNRYIGRTFIRPTQEEREKGVSIKLNVLKNHVRNKEIILVDDSIVRGTTIKRLIKKLKQAGAKKVHVRIACPPVIYSEKLSIDIPDESKLIAYGKSEEEIRDFIGCDSLSFLSLRGLRASCGNRGYYEKYFTGKSPLDKE